MSVRSVWGNKEVWSVVGRFSVLVTLVVGGLELASRIASTEADLQTTVDFAPFRYPPIVQQVPDSVEAVIDTLIALYSTDRIRAKLDEHLGVAESIADSLVRSSLVQDLSWSRLDLPSLVDRVRLGDHAWFVYLTIVNEGEEEAEKVEVVYPIASQSLVIDPDGDETRIEASPIDVGSIRGREAARVLIWTDQFVAAHQLTELSVTYRQGLSDVRFTMHATGLFDALKQGVPWFVLPLLVTGIPILLFAVAGYRELSKSRSLG